MIEIRFEKEKQRAAAYDVQDAVASDVQDAAGQTTAAADGQATAAAAGEPIGVCTYELSGPDWAVTHTKVDAAYGGQGIAGKLVAAVVDAARAEGVKIIPICSYAAHQFEKHAEYADVLSDTPAKQACFLG